MRGFSKKKGPAIPEYIVICEDDKVWVGIHSGCLLKFSSNWDEAKPLVNDTQFECLQRMTSKKLEKLYI